MYFRYFHRPFTAFRSRLVVLSLRVIRQAVAHPFHVEIAHMCECHGSIHTLFSLCPWSQPRAVPIVVAETYRHPIVPGWRPQRQAAAAASTTSSCPLVLLLVGRLVLLESSLPHRATPAATLFPLLARLCLPASCAHRRQLLPHAQVAQVRQHRRHRLQPPGLSLLHCEWRLKSHSSATVLPRDVIKKLPQHAHPLLVAVPDVHGPPRIRQHF